MTSIVSVPTHLPSMYKLHTEQQGSSKLPDKHSPQPSSIETSAEVHNSNPILGYLALIGPYLTGLFAQSGKPTRLRMVFL